MRFLRRMVGLDKPDPDLVRVTEFVYLSGAGKRKLLFGWFAAMILLFGVPLEMGLAREVLAAIAGFCLGIAVAYFFPLYRRYETDSVEEAGDEGHLADGT